MSIYLASLRSIRLRSHMLQRLRHDITVISVVVDTLVGFPRYATVSGGVVVVIEIASIG